jgi:hypothetical protein
VLLLHAADSIQALKILRGQIFLPIIEGRLGFRMMTRRAGLGVRYVIKNRCIIHQETIDRRWAGERAGAMSFVEI